ncbi:MAG TPA: DUF1847 domain-containing protein [Syntrophorhabdaceae bacterium]
MKREKKKEKEPFSCSSCGLLNCYRRDKSFPRACLTTALKAGDMEEVLTLYKEEGQDSQIARAAAEIEGTYFGKLTRVEEIIEFARRMGARKIGIASCVGLMNETRIFAQVLEKKGLKSYTVICKVASIDKTEIGIPESLKVEPGCHESLCNPILQAKLLNKEKTDLNVIVGLCVGHDSLFVKYSKALVTTLITKDRVLGHNPAAGLYTSGFYYKRLLTEEPFAPHKED